jgi:Na+/melibiose symporter-like transporter
MPRRVLNRTFLACVAIDFIYYFSGYFVDTYYASWVYVVVDWNDRNYTFFNNILTVGLCGLAWIVGLAQRYTHRYKYIQITGLCIRCLAYGLTYASASNPSDALLVSSRVITSLGGVITVMCSQVASQGVRPP